MSLIRWIVVKNNTDINVCITPGPNTSVHISDIQFQSSAIPLGVINPIFAVPTTIFNLLVIVAIFTTQELKTPSYHLLTSLAFTDLVMGLVCQPLYSLTALSFARLNFKTLCYLHDLSTYSSVFVICASGLTITAISVDRYLAISLKMRYRSTVTLPRVRSVLVSIWIVVMLVTSLPFYTPHNLIGLMCILSFVICSFVVGICYTRSFRALKVYRNQLQPQGSQQENNTSPNVLDVLKYRKLLHTMVLILVLIIICYLPLLVIFISLSRIGTVQTIIVYSMLSIMGINSLLNPIVYLVRMRDIRQACVRILKRLHRCKV